MHFIPVPTRKYTYNTQKPKKEKYAKMHETCVGASNYCTIGMQADLLTKGNNGFFRIHQYNITFK